MKKKRCKKHWWYDILVEHQYTADIRPGAVNHCFGTFRIDICSSCGKVK